MADRKQKRKKVAQETPQNYNTDLFRSLGCQKFYEAIDVDSNFVKERALSFALGEFEEMQENIRRRGWERFVAYPKEASKGLVFEFFSNVYPKTKIDGQLVFPNSTSYVRGHNIPFGSETINELFGVPSVPIPDCMYKTRMRKNVQEDPARAEEMRATLCRPGLDWKRNERGEPQKIYTRNLNPIAKGWAAFIFATFSPCSNQSELNISRATLATCIMRGEPVNLGWFLAHELREFARFEEKKIGWWRHASLIALLCEKAGVVADADEPTVPPGTTITGSWIRANSIPMQEQVPSMQRQEPPVQREEPQEEQADDPGPTFDWGDFQPQASAADVQELQARMDNLIMDQQKMAEELGWMQEQHRAGMQKMAEDMERMQDQQRIGMQAMYRAFCASQRGERLDPDADIFQTPSQSSGHGRHGM